MSRSMAGATQTGAFIERYVVSNMLSATPVTILARVAAEAGAISMRSAHSPKDTWLCQDPSRRSKNSETTGFCVRVERVRGVINSLPEGVMTTCTSAPIFMRRRISVALL